MKLRPSRKYLKCRTPEVERKQLPVKSTVLPSGGRSCLLKNPKLHYPGSGRNKSVVEVHHTHELLETFDSAWLELGDGLHFVRQRSSPMLSNAMPEEINGGAHDQTGTWPH